jgi:hypothetical protein
MTITRSTAAADIDQTANNSQGSMVDEDVYSHHRKNFHKTAKKLEESADLPARIDWLQDLKSKLRRTGWQEASWVEVVRPFLPYQMEQTIPEGADWAMFMEAVLGWKEISPPRRVLMRMLRSSVQTAGKTTSHVARQVDHLLSCLITLGVELTEEVRMDYLLTALDPEREAYFEAELEKRSWGYEMLLAAMSKDHRTPSSSPQLLTMAASKGKKPSNKAGTKIPTGYCNRGCGAKYARGHRCNDEYYKLWASLNLNRA